MTEGKGLIAIPNTKKSLFFTDEQLQTTSRTPVPHHVAIIPDGNRRWATQHDTDHDHGHQKGADGILDIVEAARDLGVKVITFYTFSTENWLRPPDEVQALMALLEVYLTEQRPRMIREGVRLSAIGDLSKLPPQVLQALNDTRTATADQDQIEVILAINYGARDEICRAVQKIVEEAPNKHINKDFINEHTIAQYLDTHLWPDPDLLIRTSGEKRISNFLLWQSSYTEIYFTKVLWPNFTSLDLLEAISDYQHREQRRGI